MAPGDCFVAEDSFKTRTESSPLSVTYIIVVDVMPGVYILQ